MSLNIFNSNFLLAFKLIKTNNIVLRGLATHWDPKYRKLRANKVVKPTLPDYEKVKGTLNQKNETAEERRSRLIKEGISPPISFEYKPINFTTSSEIFDSYVPPEGDGKSSMLSKEKVQSFIASAKKYGEKKLKHERAIKKYDESFDTTSFAEQAQQIYIDAHNALMNRDSEKLLECVTELAYSKMWVNMRYKTMRWKWIEPLEQTVVKHLITREMVNKSDMFAQVTVRLHSKQILAVYDRFGRLAFGSEKVEKDVLEYVVFERHLTSQFSSWRMHDKIVPDWCPPKEPILRSFIVPKQFKVDEKITQKLESKFKNDESHLEEKKSAEKQLEASK